MVLESDPDDGESLLGSMMLVYILSQSIGDAFSNWKHKEQTRHIFLLNIKFSFLS